MKSGKSSWWVGCAREMFILSVGTKFAVNKAAQPCRGGPALTKSMTKAHSSRGGRSGRPVSTDTSCRFGHLFTPENTVIRTDGQRLCRICKKANQKRYKDRVKAEAEARERLAG